MARNSTLRNYYLLTKPGIIRGNAITAAAGFFLASQGNIKWSLFLVVLTGLSLVIGSAGAYNNYIDRRIDKKMARTKNRALVQKTIPPLNALIYASVLGLTGLVLIIAFTNFLTAAIALAGWFFYVVVYGIWKRRSVHGTLVGSISGAVPPLVGYCAVTNRLDLGALLLFLILVFWQMPHFYAIAVYRAKDYAAAGLPVLPVKKDPASAKKQIIFYLLGFIVVSLSLAVHGYAGYTYAVVMALLGLAWLGLGLKGLNVTDTNEWAGGMFRFSLLVITGFSIVLSADAWLP